MAAYRRLAVLFAAVLASCGGSSGAAPSPSPGPGPVSPPAPGPAPSPLLVPPDGKIYLGAFVNTGGPGAATPAMLSDFERQIGRKVALSMHYRGWAVPFPSGDEADDAANGRVPVISWNCGMPNAQVVAGAGDANIAVHADSLKAYGRPVFLRYQWEMNLSQNSNGRTQCYDAATDLPGGLFSQAQFIAAWKHIRAIFAARGATNVIWLWNPSAGNSNDPTAYYPGADQVDWVGLDQYDRSDVPFAQTYSLYAPLAAYGKPMLIAETGANPANQVAFFQAAASSLRTQFPLVKGWMYFDSAGAVDWHLSSAGTTAFAALGQDAYLSATPPP